MIDIKDKSACCGCSACVQRCPVHCIAMHDDEEFFPYPLADASKCINCHLCEKVCPVIHQGDPRTPLEVLAAKNLNDTYRLSSSSGGLFTSLAEHVIEKGGVVFGACWNEEWKVKHDYTENLQGLSNFRSSKYLQSVIGDSFLKAERFLKAGREVMFTGTPCQIAGLKLFLRRDYKNLLTVDVICHSVPSPGIWQQYLTEKLQQLKWRIADIRHISFRNKKKGWKNYSIIIKNKDGRTFSETSSKNPFMRGFLANLYTRPSCFACPAKELKSGSDITLGDYWGIAITQPELDDDKGVSAVVVNTEKGQAYLQAIKGVGMSTASWKDLCKRNPAIIHSTTPNRLKEEFWNKRNTSIEARIKKLCKRPLNIRGIIWNALRIIHLK